jgi:HSP20 family protein
LNRIFDFDKDFTRTEDMLNRMFNAIKESGTTIEENLPYYYGYQITVCLDGKPHEHEFGNKSGINESVKQNNIREPLIDTNFNKKENTYIITAEMPGVAKEDIKINLNKKSIMIKADNGDKKYQTEIPIDLELNDFFTKTSYTNGILELKIKVKEQPKQKPKELKVE